MKSLFYNHTYRISKYGSVVMSCKDMGSNHIPLMGYPRSITPWVGQKELHMSQYSFYTYLTVFSGIHDCVEDFEISCLVWKDILFQDIFKP